MRIPGTRPLTTKLVTAFEITPSDKRVIVRGYRDLKGTAVGAAGGYLASGGDFIRDPKGAAVFVVTSAVATMMGKRTREQIGAAANVEEQKP